MGQGRSAGKLTFSPWRPWRPGGHLSTCRRGFSPSMAEGSNLFTSRTLLMRGVRSPHEGTASPSQKAALPYGEGTDPLSWGTRWWWPDLNRRAAEIDAASALGLPDGDDSTFAGGMDEAPRPDRDTAQLRPDARGASKRQDGPSVPGEAPGDLPEARRCDAGEPRDVEAGGPSGASQRRGRAQGREGRRGANGGRARGEVARRWDVPALRSSLM
jgi:hypothetical protein